MKNLIKYVLVLVGMASGSVYAQKSSIDSPHNYKRPVFQQRKALAESNSVSVMSQSSNKIKNDISSVHNYKRQGRANFASEASLVVSMPPSQSVGMNPLMASGNYKSHFTSTEFGKQIVARKITNEILTTMNITKEDSTSNN
ncbi:hypothetical protein Emtol_0782 [Emticicia oligotrophica DSM 17448]|uniref:Uncharacterized protein n=1 Tax=Emticicia oligotrophica (strain DSM 17448 / CIP 109782 / MTCC 6937 / GPTSA100-15) TaxID=929562 RepID=A0ABM5MXR6_EMTOG|nr:hypothetical protein [Emticicia oligotrophica]AFK01934.1 hypothetical protein Emtol_0782 [Emticicia oligotrophica DSM 17448]